MMNSRAQEVKSVHTPLEYETPYQNNVIKVLLRPILGGGNFYAVIIYFTHNQSNSLLITGFVTRVS
jgi:hypothetical protein